MTAAAVPPSGEQYELRHGDAVVTVVGVGGGVRTYTVHGRDVLDGYALDEICVGARGQTLVPWPNRIDRGRYSFRGRDLQVALTEPERDNAIHGLLRWHEWRPPDGERRPDAITLACRVYPQPGYPFVLDVRNDYTLDGTGLTVTTTARNAGAAPCPYALGFHPYLTVGTGRIDEAVLHLPAATYLPTDDRGIPTGRESVAGTPYDFREPRPIGATEIDVAYADLDRDADGRANVTLATADGTGSVVLWVDGSFPYVEIFTGDTLPEDQRRRGLGVEPMTGPPNAFGTGTDVVELAPGESVTTSWGVRPTVPAG